MLGRIRRIPVFLAIIDTSFRLSTTAEAVLPAFTVSSLQATRTSRHRYPAGCESAEHVERESSFRDQARTSAACTTETSLFAFANFRRSGFLNPRDARIGMICNDVSSRRLLRLGPSRHPTGLRAQLEVQTDRTLIPTQIRSEPLIGRSYILDQLQCSELNHPALGSCRGGGDKGSASARSLCTALARGGCYNEHCTGHHGNRCSTRPLASQPARSLLPDPLLLTRCHRDFDKSLSLWRKRARVRATTTAPVREDEEGANARGSMEAKVPLATEITSYESTSLRRQPCPRTNWTRRVPCPRTNRTRVSPNAPPFSPPY